MSDFDDVGHFHEKFALDSATHRGVGPREVPADLVDFRVKFLKEELRELEEGYAANDQAKVADALIDLVYVALGTAQLHGFPWAELFAEVQRANMSKVRATSAAESTRGSSFDVVKPPDFQPPDINGVLRKAGWAL